MQTDNGNTETGDSDIREIRLEPGIYDLTSDIKKYIEDETPLSDEEQNILKTFHPGYSFDEDIKERGKAEVLEGINEDMELFDLDEAKIAVQEGIKAAQQINPDIRIEPFPIIFLAMPISRNATALYGQGCAINIDVPRRHKNIIKPKDFVRKAVAHETTHLFLQQLGVRPKEDEHDSRKMIENFIWEEGLTTYIEQSNTGHHNQIIIDRLFWIDIISNWINAKNNLSQKQELYDKCLSVSYIQTDPRLPKDLNRAVDVNKHFVYEILRHQGIGYHIGSYLWNREIEKAKKEGKTLKDLVMAGSGQMEDWMKN